MNKEVEKIYKRKIKEIQKHNKLYFEKSKPIISDAKFDELKNEIINLEKKYIFLKSNKIEDSFIQLKQLVKQEAGNKCFIGSSLGGFYASFFAEQFNAKAVLINPASTPYLGMEMYLGMNTNHATNEEFEITY